MRWKSICCLLLRYKRKSCKCFKISTVISVNTGENSWWHKCHQISAIYMMKEKDKNWWILNIDDGELLAKDIILTTILQKQNKLSLSI